MSEDTITIQKEEREINKEIVNRFYSRMKMEEVIQLRDIFSKT